MKKPLWPDQYVNRKVQEHDETIADLLRRVEKLEKAKPKPGRPRKVAVKGDTLKVKE